MAQMMDKGLISALRTLAKAINNIPGGYGRNTAARLETAADRLAMLAQGIGPNDIVERLRAANDRIAQLERERHTILHLWYKGRDTCAVCAHKCTNVEAESCSECERECLCLVCNKGENWEEAQNK